MKRIYAKAQQDLANRYINELLSMLDKITDEDLQIVKAKIRAQLEKMAAKNRGTVSKTTENTGLSWDFRREKKGPGFSDGTLRIRPFSANDKEFYSEVREQYRIFDKGLSKEQLADAYWTETERESGFFCMVERVRDGAKLGYIALKDTSKDLWEVAIELDKAYCHCGYGPAAVMLFLHNISEITDKTAFQFLVEVDNLPCQKCMEKLGAELVGIHNLAFDSEEEAKEFEDENMELITEHMTALANKSNIPPKKLLSHVLDYRLKVDAPSETQE